MACIELEDYLALENARRDKHEYLDGVIYTVQGEAVRGMASGSQAHSRIIRNMGFALHRKLQGSPCEVLSSDMRLRIDAASAVFYPDVLVHGQPTDNPQATLELTEARLVVEVLSPGTQLFDRSAKLAAYRQLAGLQHIVLLSSTEQAAWAWVEWAPRPEGAGPRDRRSRIPAARLVMLRLGCCAAGQAGDGAATGCTAAQSQRA